MIDTAPVFHCLSVSDYYSPQLSSSAPKMLKGLASRKLGVLFPFQGFVKQVPAARKYSSFGATLEDSKKVSTEFLRNRKIVPKCDPPRNEDADQLYKFIDRSRNLMVLTGAGISTESGIPDYRSPNGAYSTGFKPITHQEFVRSTRARRRYWARSYAGWKRFTAAKPGPTHVSLASLESVGRMNFMVTQNVDSHFFQDRVKALNPQWASAVESIESGTPGSDKSFGMQQRPDGDIEIDEKFWEEDFHIPN